MGRNKKQSGVKDSGKPLNLNCASFVVNSIRFCYRISQHFLIDFLPLCYAIVMRSGEETGLYTCRRIHVRNSVL